MTQVYHRCSVDPSRSKVKHFRTRSQRSGSSCRSGSGWHGVVARHEWLGVTEAAARLGLVVPRVEVYRPASDETASRIGLTPLLTGGLSLA